MNLVSQIFGILMAVGGFTLAILQRADLAHSIPLDGLCGGLILVGAFLLTPDKIKAAADELGQYLPWHKGP